jgi:hypothetical protein
VAQAASVETIEQWRRTYREHAKHPDDARRCGAVGCYGPFPCSYRLDAAELLILAGVGVSERRDLPKWAGRIVRKPTMG